MLVYTKLQRWGDFDDEGYNHRTYQYYKCSKLDSPESVQAAQRIIDGVHERATARKASMDSCIRMEMLQRYVGQAKISSYTNAKD